MKYFIVLLILLFSISLFAGRSGGRVGGRSFSSSSSSSRSSSSSSSRSSSSKSSYKSSSSSKSGSSYKSSSSSYKSSSSKSYSGSSYSKPKVIYPLIFANGSKLVQEPFGTLFLIESTSRNCLVEVDNMFKNNYKPLKIGGVTIGEGYVYIMALSSDNIQRYIWYTIGGIVLIFIIRKIIKKRKNNDNKTYTYYNHKYGSIKIQFAFHATIYKLRKEFISVAEKLNFDDQNDLKQLILNFINLSEDNNSYIKYGNIIKTKVLNTEKEAEKKHDEYIEEELSKLSEETYLKIENYKSVVKQLKEENQPDFMEIKEYIVFTLVVTYKNFEIQTKDDYSYEYYKTILEKLKFLNPNDILAAEIVWTPDAENDVLTEDDIIMNYNNLKTV